MVVPSRFSCAIFVACFALVSARADDYVRLTASDSVDDSSFIQSARWSDKRAPR